MSASSEGTQVFIIRVWREPREIQGAHPLWRGLVEHVPTGERSYFDHFHALLNFMLSHLRRVGVRPGLCLRACLRLANTFHHHGRGRDRGSTSDASQT